MRYRALLVLACAGPGGCVIDGEDPCEAPADQVYESWVLGGTTTQAYLTTPAAAKDCHATFAAQLAYAGDDAFDPELPRPLVDVSANAVGTGGEQPGLVGIMTDWRMVEDPDSGAIAWWAELSAGARNVDAPAVFYGMAGVVQPGQTLAVDYYAQIDYLPPPDEPVDEGAAARCRR